MYLCYLYFCIYAPYVAHNGLAYRGGAQYLPDRLPRSDKAFFTHGGTAPRNIMVNDDGHILVLLDWESFGWISVWEFVQMMKCDKLEGDPEWCRDKLSGLDSYCGEFGDHMPHTVPAARTGIPIRRYNTTSCGVRHVRGTWLCNLENRTGRSDSSVLVLAIREILFICCVLLVTTSITHDISKKHLDAMHLTR